MVIGLEGMGLKWIHNHESDINMSLVPLICLPP